MFNKLLFTHNKSTHQKENTVDGWQEGKHYTYNKKGERDVRCTVAYRTLAFTPRYTDLMFLSYISQFIACIFINKRQYN